MCASKWEVFLALKLIAVLSPHLPPAKGQKQCCALCWAGSDEKHGATPDPALAAGTCTRAVPVHGGGAARPCPIAVRAGCQQHASTAWAEHLLPQHQREWGNSASLLPAWATPLRSPPLPGASREEGLDQAWCQQQQMQQLPSAAGCKGLEERRPLPLAKPFVRGKLSLRPPVLVHVTGEELLGANVFKDASGKALSLVALGWGTETRGPGGVPPQGAGQSCLTILLRWGEQQGKSDSQSRI